MIVTVLIKWHDLSTMSNKVRQKTDTVKKFSVGLQKIGSVGVSEVRKILTLTHKEYFLTRIVQLKEGLHSQTQ